MKIDKKKLFIQCAKKGWSAFDLAKAVGVGKAAVYGYIKHNVRATTLGRLAKALECEPEELLE